MIRYLLIFCLTYIQYAVAMCDMAIRQFERVHGIPDKLLKAISLVESGRKMPGGQHVAWPWTINANGTPYVFSSKREAVTKVKELQAAGIDSIDVGCMQVNLKYHPTAFRNLEEAFDPYTNIAYAARFLKQKQLDHGSWHTAVAHYHSATPEHHIPYRERVLKTWATVKQTPAYGQPTMTTALYPGAIPQTPLQGPQVQFKPYDRPAPPGGIPGRIFAINTTAENGRGAQPAVQRVGGALPQQIPAIKAAYRLKQYPMIKAEIEKNPSLETGALRYNDRRARGFPIH